MTRKAFIADVASAAARSISGVSQVVRGAEDGELDFCFTSPFGPLINVHILALDVSSYPSENTFMMYSETEDAPESVRNVLETLQNYSAGLRVSELISQISSELQKALADGSRNNPFSVEEDEMDEDESNYGDDWSQSPINDEPMTYAGINPEAATKLNKRIREDLRAVRNAGFRVGILRGLKADSQASVLSISAQVSRLGLSDEAIQAWDLEKQQHVVLLVRYSAGYKSFDAIINEAARSHEVEFRVGISHRYKPTVNEAIAAFTSISKKESSDLNKVVTENDDQSQVDDSFAGFSSLFISSSLNDFINEQFTSLLKIRHKIGTGWDGAKLFYNDSQGRAGLGCQLTVTNLPSDYFSESTTTKTGLTALVTTDHIQDAKNDRFSFPLIAMQFVMRYLTRCTEFCLICHDKTQETFEALKPYVCSKPLCLYQYINLGFGPSVEHEILTQPHVADLLISFCYASVRGRRLREFPIGMSLSVPPLREGSPLAGLYRAGYSPIGAYSQVPASNDSRIAESHDDSYKVKYDSIRQELVLEQDKPCLVRRGDWVVLTSTVMNDKKSTHHKVLDVLYPTVKLSPFAVTRANQANYVGQALSVSGGQSPLATPTPTPPPMATVEMAIYNQNFDELTDEHKSESMVMLLETIPSITEMRTYLKQQQHTSQPSLQTWTDRISSAALGLLRWIIASNRSSIVQVDLTLGQEENGDLMKKNSRPDERVSNMDGYVQFRFAQGAPDKEHRFHLALKDTQGRHNKEYPTIFAWHGSGLENWHSIIRSGLDFKDTINGRACGHGVYHSLEYTTSRGYSREHSMDTTWPGSELKATSAICLNEIVNEPDEYVCKAPHLVVQHLDWIQCRYLFVRAGSSAQNEVRTGSDPSKYSRSRNRDVAEIELDKNYTVKGPNGKPIGIPRNAFPVSREFRLKSADKIWGFSSTQNHGLRRDFEVVDDTEDEEDLLFLLSDDESLPPAPAAKGKGIWGWKGKGKGKRAEEVVILDPEPRKRARSQTNFVPDSVDQATLQILEPPIYATSKATQVLNRELKAVLKIQDSTPLHELGWYINRNMVQNVYQWIVELHSFDPDLPLSNDMKNAGIKSIILELRFGKDFPNSPPFIRVIRPRFLPFTMGGGGHVTAGGAMCMELLTNSGWSPVSSIESVLLQVRMAITNCEPRPARLEAQGKQRQHDYGAGEAMDAYVRACRAHNWEVPKDFKEFATGSDGLYGGF